MREKSVIYRPIIEIENKLIKHLRLLFTSNTVGYWWKPYLVLLGISKLTKYNKLYTSISNIENFVHFALICPWTLLLHNSSTVTDVSGSSRCLGHCIHYRSGLGEPLQFDHHWLFHARHRHIFHVFGESVGWFSFRCYVEVSGFAV